MSAADEKRMYRGITPPLFGVTPIFAISFWGYDLGKRLVYSLTPDRKDSSLSLGELALAGAVSAVPATLVAGPAERVKVLLQVGQAQIHRLLPLSPGRRRCRCQYGNCTSPDSSARGPSARKS
jgi:hypothetical protein